MKICKRCGVKKGRSEFRFSKKYHKHYKYCKMCEGEIKTIRNISREERNGFPQNVLKKIEADYIPSERSFEDISNDLTVLDELLYMRQQERIALDTTRRSESRVGGFWYGNSGNYIGPNYCEKFNNEFKERARAFWDYRCFLCGLPQEFNIDRLGRVWRLNVHHIHYDKKMCCNGSPQDVVPLCLICHSPTSVTSNRVFWEVYLTGLLYTINPDGKCFFSKSEMKERFKICYKPYNAIEEYPLKISERGVEVQPL